MRSFYLLSDISPTVIVDSYLHASCCFDYYYYEICYHLCHHDLEGWDCENECVDESN